LAPPKQENRANTNFSSGQDIDSTGDSLQRFQFNEPSPDDHHHGTDINMLPTTTAVSILPPSSATKKPPPSTYTPEAAIVKACKAASDGEVAGGRSGLHLVVLGHVDAGKSTLMGRLLYELGLIEDKKVHKTKKEATAAGKSSFAWAWMLDERPEERARGVTIDVAMTRFETPHHTVTLLDAPGHRDFIPNMITGAAQADAALLIVDGSPGGFEAGFSDFSSAAGSHGGQTREHAQLARSLGISQVAVVVTKLDTVDYDQSRFDHIKANLEPYLIDTVGFKRENVQWIPAVGPTGENLVKKSSRDNFPWWNGNNPGTLVDAIDAFQPIDRPVELPLRMPVGEVGKGLGAAGGGGGGGGGGGFSVSGKIERGAVIVGGTVLITPSSQLAKVKAILVDGKPATLARAGDNTDLSLSPLSSSNIIDATTVYQGAVVCLPDWPVPLTSAFQLEVVVLPAPIPLLQGCQVTIHAHTAKESGHVSKLVALLDSKTGQVIRQKPRCLLPGQSAVIQVTASRAMCLEQYAECRALGRVALRDGGRTVAVGVVTDIDPQIF
jgi:elongation factor 1 alpha-like protein